MRLSKGAQKVNAGSMADIAFLLLIFFLVTTTMATDIGINRKLPRICPNGEDCIVDINERNILRIKLNKKQEVMINDELVSIENIKTTAKLFIDNNGDDSCNYCAGEKLKISSENPTKAVISLQNSRETSYELFVKVQDELTKAYNELRTVYAFERYGKSLDELSSQELKLTKEAYPFIISEAETN